MSKYLGDFAAGDILDFKFTTFRPSTGAAYTLAGTPAVSVYKSNSTTQSTTGVTLTVDFDSVTGLHHVRVDTSADGTFYADGSQFEVVITAGTVDSVSVVGACVGRFTLRAQAALYPTTPGRKLDVSSGGEAGVDWANVGSPTTTVNLSATTVKTATDVETDTQDIQSRLPAALVSGRMDSNVQAMADSVITAAKIATDAITAAKIAADAIGSSQLAGTAVTEIQSGLSTLDAAGVRLAVGMASANLDTQLAAINDKTTNLPSDPADQSDLVALLNAIIAYIDTEVAAIKAKTDNLPASPAAVGSAMTLATDAVNAAALAADAIAEIQAGTSLVDIATMVTGDGTAGAKFTATALSNAPGGGGGGGLTSEQETILLKIAAMSGVLGGSQTIDSANQITQRFSIPLADGTDGGEELVVTITRESSTVQSFTSEVV